MRGQRYSKQLSANSAFPLPPDSGRLKATPEIATRAGCATRPRRLPRLCTIVSPSSEEPRLLQLRLLGDLGRFEQLAHLGEVAREFQEVCLDRRLQRALVQGRRRVVHRHDDPPIDRLRLTVDLR